MLITGLLLLFVAALVAFTAQIWLIGLTFQRSVTWGILVVMAILSRLILGYSETNFQPDPQVYILLGLAISGSFLGIVITDWQNAKTAFFWYLSSIALGAVGFVLVFANLGEVEKSLSKRHLAGDPRAQKQVAQIRDALRNVRLPFARAATPAPATPVPRRVQATPSYVSILPPLIEGGKQHAAAGTFYMVDRASVVTKTGVRAVCPGDTVQLRERLRDGKLRVSYGADTFVVAESQVTEDLATAREAEKRDFLEHSGRL